MKKNLILAFLVAILVIFTGCTTAEPSVALGRPAIFFVPHQDDELLSMGAAIQAHVAAGRDVYVVQVGDGTKSGVRPQLCDRYSFCPEMTEQDFGHSRDLENQDSLLALGVKPDHIFREHKPENSIGYYAGPVIDKYIARFGPTASYATMSWLDIHPDHRALGNVLNNRYGKGIIKDVRFYQFQRYWNNVPTPRSGYYNPTDRAGIDKATSAYYYENISQDRFGIGSKSVPSDFNALKANPASKWHLPNNQWNSTADQLAASAWIKKCYVTPVPVTCYN